MTRGEYNDKRGWTMPEGENGQDAGYFITYPDGYISWSPSHVFERSYRLANTWQQRLLNEFEDLSEKVVALEEFLALGDARPVKISSDDLEAMEAQLQVMEAYQGILALRMGDAGISPVSGE